MVDFSSIASGFRQQGIDDRATRKDIAETFAQFRKDNPHATLEDMQNQMSILSGGRNYLRAGLPDKDTLSRIAASNLEAKNQAELQKNFENFNEKHKIQEIFRERAEEFLKKRMTSEQFLGKTKDAQEAALIEIQAEFEKTMQQNLGTDLNLDMKKTIQNVFTRENAALIRDDIFTKNMGELETLTLDLLKTKRNKNEQLELTQAEINHIANQTFIPTWKIKQHFDKVKADYELSMVEEKDKFLANQSAIVKDFMAAYHQDWLAGTKTSDQIKTEATNMLNARATERNLPIAQSDIDALINGNFSNLVATWEVGKAQKLDSDYKHIQEIGKSVLDSLFTSTGELNKTAFLAFKREGSGGLVSLAAKVLERKFPDSYFNSRFGEGSADEQRALIMAEITDFVNGQADAMAQIQKENYDTWVAKNEGLIRPQLDAEKEKIKKDSTALFEGGGYINTTMKNGELAGGNMVSAINRLTDEFYINNSHLDILAAAIKEYTPTQGGSVAELESYFRSILGNNMISWSDREAQLKKATVDNLPNQQTFTDWQAPFMSSFDFAFDKITSNISEMENAINANTIDATTLPKLNAIMSQITATKTEINNAINTAGKHEGIWVLDGQPDDWDWTKANAMGQQLWDKLNALKEQVQELKNNPDVANYNPSAVPEQAQDEEVKAITSIYGTNAKGSSQNEIDIKLKGLFVKRVQEVATRLTENGFANITATRAGGSNKYGNLAGVLNIPSDSSLLNAKNLKVTPDEALQIQNQIRDTSFIYKLVQNKANMEAFIANPLEFIADEKNKLIPDIFKDSSYLKQTN